MGWSVSEEGCEILGVDVRGEEERLVGGSDSEEGPKTGWPAVLRSSSGCRGSKLGLPLGVCVVSPVKAETIAPYCWTGLESVVCAPPKAPPGTEPVPVPLGDTSTAPSPRTTIDSSTPDRPCDATLMLLPSSPATVMLVPSSPVICWSSSLAVVCVPLGVSWGLPWLAASLVWLLSSGRLGSVLTDISSSIDSFRRFEGLSWTASTKGGDDRTSRSSALFSNSLEAASN